MIWINLNLYIGNIQSQLHDTDKLVLGFFLKPSIISSLLVIRYYLQLPLYLNKMKTLPKPRNTASEPHFVITPRSPVYIVNHSHPNLNRSWSFIELCRVVLEKQMGARRGQTERRSIINPRLTTGGDNEGCFGQILPRGFSGKGANADTRVNNKQI